jgi:hypothetical protein
VALCALKTVKLNLAYELSPIARNLKPETAAFKQLMLPKKKKKPAFATGMGTDFRAR